VRKKRPQEEARGPRGGTVRRRGGGRHLWGGVSEVWSTALYWASVTSVVTVGSTGLPCKEEGEVSESLDTPTPVSSNKVKSSKLIRQKLTLAQNYSDRVCPKLSLLVLLVLPLVLASKHLNLAF